MSGTTARATNVSPEEEERRIRRGVERLRFQAVEVEVHGVLVSIPQIVTRVDRVAPGARRLAPMRRRSPAGG